MQMLSEPLCDPLILAAPASYSLPALQAALLEGYGLAGEFVALGGERDRNFRLRTSEGESYLVKLTHPAEDAAITDFQTKALLHLEATAPDLSLPRIVRTRTGQHGLPHDSGPDGVCQLRVLTFVAGQPMSGVTATPGQHRQLGALAARLDRAFEGFTHPADRRRLLWDIREADSHERLLPMVDDAEQSRLVTWALAAYREQAVERLAHLPTQVIHNDLNPHNILVDLAQPDRLTGVIDFGDMLRATRVQEVATACAYLLSPAPAPLQDVAAFVAGYAGVSSLADAELQLLPTLMAMRMAVTVLVTNWRARLQPENASYIRRNLPSAIAGLRCLSMLGAQTAVQAIQSGKGD